ncbi:MAG: hypothetical protein JXA93_04825 [Anaerolineae bacterium]|nr:hypothetical protein [Anaerolineae bacterium]
MGTLYVVGVPAGDPDDLTHRARRVLESARQWAAADVAGARSRLAACGVAEPAAGIATCRDVVATLAEGDVALVVDGARPGVDEEERRLVGAALEGGFPVVPVPGPALPLTALVISGLPADTFCYMGELPGQTSARDDLIQALAEERRTLLFLVQAVDAASTLSDLYTALGDRPLVVVSAGSGGQSPPWRGTLEAACEEMAGLLAGDVHVLVVGGATEGPAAWDEARLDATIAQRVARGEGARQISQALAGVSRWSRREIYRRVIEHMGRRRDG